jgi:hypothetical protein
MVLHKKWKNQMKSDLTTNTAQITTTMGAIYGASTLGISSIIYAAGYLTGYLSNE